jgi:hypothetical protein
MKRGPLNRVITDSSAGSSSSPRTSRSVTPLQRMVISSSQSMSASWKEAGGRARAALLSPNSFQIGSAGPAGRARARLPAYYGDGQAYSAAPVRAQRCGGCSPRAASSLKMRLHSRQVRGVFACNQHPPPAIPWSPSSAASKIRHHGRQRDSPAPPAARFRPRGGGAAGLLAPRVSRHPALLSLLPQNLEADPKEQAGDCCDTDDWAVFYSRARAASAVIADKSTLLFDKTPRYMRELSTVMARVPQLPCVVNVRDPRAVMHSWACWSGFRDAPGPGWSRISSPTANAFWSMRAAMPRRPDGRTACC